jgi:hypothetical protein
MPTCDEHVNSMSPYVRLCRDSGQYQQPLQIILLQIAPTGTRNESIINSKTKSSRSTAAGEATYVSRCPCDSVVLTFGSKRLAFATSIQQQTPTYPSTFDHSIFQEKVCVFCN